MSCEASHWPSRVEYVWSRYHSDTWGNCFVVYLRSYYVTALPDWTVPWSEELHQPSKDQTTASCLHIHLSASGRSSRQPTSNPFIHRLMWLKETQPVEVVYSMCMVEFIRHLYAQQNCYITAIRDIVCVIKASKQKWESWFVASVADGHLYVTEIQKLILRLRSLSTLKQFYLN